MNWLKRNKGKILSVLIVIVICVVAYFADGINPQKDNEDTEHNETKILSLPENKIEGADDETGNVETENKVDTDIYVKEQPLPEIISEPDKKMRCSLSVNCDIINQNIELLNESKKSLIPQDGMIYKQENVVIDDGDSVFDVLLREMKNNNIHFEYVDTPVYDSVYIEGINNIYEFDCGPLSGWTYRVNGVFPNYGCSQCKLKDGDIIEVLYTCNMGKDLGKN